MQVACLNAPVGNVPTSLESGKTSTAEKKGVLGHFHKPHEQRSQIEY